MNLNLNNYSTMEESNNGYILFDDEYEFNRLIYEEAIEWINEKLKDVEREVMLYINVFYNDENDEHIIKQYKKKLETEGKLKYAKSFHNYLESVNPELNESLKENKPNIIFNNKEYTYDEYEEWIFVKLDM